ncbi:MAG: sugar transferase [Acidobacteria bacterium]|nr:sugar transferase [Acidobacteriota bacterium]
MKRFFDLAASAVGLALTSPILVLAMIALWLQDFCSPFYIPSRMAHGGGTFHMVKFRSMLVDADRAGGSSTAATDRRITAVGRFLRAFKIDELPQLWNVLKGDMSLVGPRPQVLTDASMYTEQEKRMLSIRPGITDLASIVFADEGDVLKGSDDPDLLYNQIIRPWKSRLALLYVDKRTFLTDLRIVALTAIGMVSRPAALSGIQRILEQWGADELLRSMARRDRALMPFPPPGATEIVMQYPSTASAFVR